MPRKFPKYVVEDTDRYGKVRVYLRRPGHKKVLLPGVPWSTEFMDAYAAVVNGSSTTKETVRGPTTGTLSWLCEQYCSSAEFKRLDKRTAKVRRRILELACAEPTKPGSDKLTGNAPISAITGRAVRALRDRISDRPEAANARLKALRAVFTYGVAAEHTDHSPARDVPYLSSDNPDGFHSWTVAEVEKFESTHAIGTKARLAMALLLYTGQRRSDVVLMGPPMEKDGWLSFTQWKNRARRPVKLTIPIRPELRAIIDASPCGATTYLVTEFGKPFKATGFGDWFSARCIEAGVPGRAHGLRKAAASRLAEAGASDREIMAITGHQTGKEVDRYTKAASQKLRAEAAFGRFKREDG